MNRPKIMTSEEWSPFAFWRAWRDGQEESGPYGQGATEMAAIADLIDQEDEEGDDT